MKHILIILISLSVLSACQSTATRSAFQEDIPLASLKDIEPKRAEFRGLLALQKIHAAEQAQNVLYKAKVNMQEAGIKGWVTDISPTKGALVYFMKGSGRSPTIVYTVYIPPKGVPQIQKTDQSAPEKLAAMYDARMTAMWSIDEPCTPDYEIAVLKEGDKLIAIAMASSQKRNRIVAGGHYRFTYDLNSRDMISKERFSKGCLLLDKTRSTYLSHYASKEPGEAHVILSLRHGPLFVKSGTGFWEIRKGKIQKRASIETTK
ncbi:hypothetical protein [Algicola sagamiensis]|uniref:hypothetical protein n=1 Tax=Algicola sagamiensis TaxID=163869 RepID=UPI000361C97B|nr:hypothetical protein [Algicola sagamiensis]